MAASYPKQKVSGSVHGSLPMDGLRPSIFILIWKELSRGLVRDLGFTTCARIAQTSSRDNGPARPSQTLK